MSQTITQIKEGEKVEFGYMTEYEKMLTGKINSVLSTEYDRKWFVRVAHHNSYVPEYSKKKVGAFFVAIFTRRAHINTVNMRKISKVTRSKFSFLTGDLNGEIHIFFDYKNKNQLGDLLYE